MIRALILSARTVGPLLARPRLWLAAGRQLVALAPDRWWKRAPFLPLPDREYLAFRLETMYGDPTTPPHPDAVLAYLEWCKEQRRVLRYPSAMKVAAVHGRPVQGRPAQGPPVHVPPTPGPSRPA